MSGWCPCSLPLFVRQGCNSLRVNVWGSRTGSNETSSAAGLLLFHALVVGISADWFRAVIVILNGPYWNCGYLSQMSAVQCTPDMTTPPALLTIALAPPWTITMAPSAIGPIAAVGCFLWSWLVWYWAVKRGGCGCPCFILVFAGLHTLEAIVEWVLAAVPVVIALYGKPHPDNPSKLLAFGAMAAVPNVIAAMYATTIVVALVNLNRRQQRGRRTMLL